MTSNPLISIVLPVYNAEKFLKEAIESILTQSYTNYEFIIINDCSTDASWKIIQEYKQKDDRIVAIKNNINLKLSKTLNKGISLSKGKYIARMDADDVSMPDRFEKQVSFLEANNDVGIIGSNIIIINEKNEVIGYRKYQLDDKNIKKNIFYFSPFAHPAVILRSSVLEKAGYYNDDFNPAEDYELYFRIGKYSDFANIDQNLLKYRIIDNSMTTGNTANMERQTIKIREQYLNNEQKNYEYNYLVIVYNLLHKLSFKLIPSKFKMKIFNLLRNY